MVRLVPMNKDGNVRFAGSSKPWRFLVMASVIIFTNFSHAAETDPSPAEVILDRYVEVTGGVEAHSAHQYRVMKGVVDFTEADIEFAAIIQTAAPDKVRFTLAHEEFGKIERGCLGDVAWELVPGAGARILTGVDYVRQKREAMLDRWANWREHYPQVRVKSQAEVFGKPATGVEIVGHNPADAQTLYFDDESGLMVKSIHKIQSAEGSILVESLVSNYKEFDGVKMPSRIANIAQGQRRVFKLTDVVHPDSIPDSVFSLPEAVQEALAEESSATE